MPDATQGAERFWSKVEKTGTCWVWRAGLNGAGYGSFWNGTRNVRAHCWAYAELVGPVPSGLVLDHLCRNRACVNPGHLEPVTLGANVLRGSGPTAVNATKTHCVNGHEFTRENTRVRTDRGGPRRDCRACDQARPSRSRRIPPGSSDPSDPA